MRYDRGTLSRLRQIAKVMDVAPSKPSKESRLKNGDDPDIEDDKASDHDQTNGDAKDRAAKRSSNKSRP